MESNNFYKKSIPGKIDSFNNINEIGYDYLNRIVEAIENEKNPLQDKNTLRSSLRFKNDLQKLKDKLYSLRNSFDNIYRYSLGLEVIYKPDFVILDTLKTWNKQVYLTFDSDKFGKLDIVVSDNRPFEKIVKIKAINDKEVSWGFKKEDIGFIFNKFHIENECMLKDFINFLYFNSCQ